MEPAKGQETALAAQCLNHMQARRMVCHIKNNLGWRCLLSFSVMHDMFTEGMRESVEKAAGFVTAVVGGLWVRLRNKVITPSSDAIMWGAIQVEGERGIVEASAICQNESSQSPKTLADSVKLSLGIRKLKS